MDKTLIECTNDVNDSLKKTLTKCVVFVFKLKRYSEYKNN